MSLQTFGYTFSRALVLGCARLSALGHDVRPEWILDIIALESAGTWDPLVLQGKARLVPASGPKDKRPEVEGTAGLRLTHGTGARGLFQVMPLRQPRKDMPVLLRLYGQTDPVQQLADKVRVLADSCIRHRFGAYSSREALYCANLAPARLIGGEYDDDTILYSADPYDEPLNMRPNGARTYWPLGYQMNARPFGLDPADPKGKLRMRDLARGLDAAAAASRARINAELEAAFVANLA